MSKIKEFYSNFSPHCKLVCTTVRRLNWLQYCGEGFKCFHATREEYEYKRKAHFSEQLERDDNEDGARRRVRIDQVLPQHFALRHATVSLPSFSRRAVSSYSWHQSHNGFGIKEESNCQFFSLIPC